MTRDQALILAVLILPMPKWLLDISLAISITLSVVILLTAMSQRASTREAAGA